MNGLPRPITNDQEYLAAILDELRGISAKLDVVIAQTTPVELEPCFAIVEPAPVPSGELVQAVAAEVAETQRAEAVKASRRSRKAQS